MESVKSVSVFELYMIKPFVIALVSFVVFDFIFLGLLMGSWYKKELGVLGRVVNGEFALNYWAAAVVYLLLALGVAVFVLPAESWQIALGRGALLGLIIYGVYDFTNLAILNKYSLRLLAVDVVWGVCVTAAASVIAKVF